MSKFIKVAAKKVMVKVNLDGVGEVWATCTPAVKTFAGKAFKEGDTVNITYEDTPAAELKHHITRIEKGDGTTKKTKAPDDGKLKCEDCGKELKDAKYKKCWACNQKKPAKSSGSYGKSPEVQASIKRQAIGHMTSRSLIALQGHIDPNNILGLTDTLYKKFQELVG